jgi:SAM-dependent methyltransferase
MDRVCAVCGNSEKRILFRQPLLAPESVSYAGYDIVVCIRCGFVFADQTISQLTSDIHYASPTKVAQNLSCAGEPENDIVRLNNTARLLPPFLHQNDRILDVGCGTGRLLSMLKQAGFPRVQGIDQSPDAVSIALEKYGIDVKCRSIFEYEEGGYDFIIVSHVLEHIVDLSAFLQRIYRMLDTDGKVYVEVPDLYQFERFADLESSGPWAFVRDIFTHFTPEHVNFFSLLSLQNLMASVGFEKVHCEAHPLGVIASVWRRHVVSQDLEGELILLRYAERSQKAQAGALEVLKQVGESGEGVLVWGAGLHTQRLLGSGAFNAVTIVGFVDSDPTYSGSRLMGKPIIGPGELSSVAGHPPIVVCSWKAQGAIVRAIESMGIPNRIVLLYPPREAK